MLRKEEDWLSAGPLCAFFGFFDIFRGIVYVFMFFCFFKIFGDFSCGAVLIGEREVK